MKYLTIDELVTELGYSDYAHEEFKHLSLSILGKLNVQQKQVLTDEGLFEIRYSYVWVPLLKGILGMLSAGDDLLYAIENMNIHLNAQIFDKLKDSHNENFPQDYILYLNKQEKDRIRAHLSMYKAVVYGKKPSIQCTDSISLRIYSSSDFIDEIIQEEHKLRVSNMFFDCFDTVEMFLKFWVEWKDMLGFIFSESAIYRDAIFCDSNSKWKIYFVPSDAIACDNCDQSDCFTDDDGNYIDEDFQYGNCCTEVEWKFDYTGKFFEILKHI